MDIYVKVYKSGPTWHWMAGTKQEFEYRESLFGGTSSHFTEFEAVSDAYSALHRVKEGKIIFPGEGLLVMLKAAALREAERRVSQLKGELDRMEVQNKHLAASGEGLCRRERLTFP